MQKYQKPNEVKISLHCNQPIKDGCDTLQLIENMISNNYSISRTSIIDDNTIEYIFVLNKDKKKRIENIFDRFGAILDELRQEIKEEEEKKILDEIGKDIVIGTNPDPWCTMITSNVDNTPPSIPPQVTYGLDKK